MPGRLGANLRSGNLAEALGVFLLKGMAAVAEVPRTEDVGLDAIASLLRYDEDGNCYAEDSFVVQFKAESVEEIEYHGFALDWFLGQEQPMFIGRVSLARDCIALYPTLFVHQAVLSLHAKRVNVRFGSSGIPPFFAGTRQGAWSGGENELATVWLGEPLLEWSVSALPDPVWREQAYHILKHFLRLARRERELLAYRQWTALDWSTNDLNSIKSGPMAMKGGSAELKDISEKTAPGLQAMMLRALGMPAENGHPLLATLICLAAALRDFGVEVDPENVFARLLLTQQATDSQSRPTPPTL